jgi:hypothetical protein
MSAILRAVVFAVLVIASGNGTLAQSQSPAIPGPARSEPTIPLQGPTEAKKPANTPVAVVEVPRYEFAVQDRYEIAFKIDSLGKESRSGGANWTEVKLIDEGKSILSIEEVFEDGSARARISVESIRQRVPDEVTGEWVENKDARFGLGIAAAGAATCIIRPDGRVSEIRRLGRDSDMSREFFLQPVLLLFAPLPEDAFPSATKWQDQVPSLWAADNEPPKKSPPPDIEDLQVHLETPEQVVLKRTRANPQHGEYEGGAIMVDLATDLESSVEARSTLARTKEGRLRPLEAEATRRFSFGFEYTRTKYKCQTETRWTVSVEKFTPGAVALGGDAGDGNLGVKLADIAPPVLDTPGSKPHARFEMAAAEGVVYQVSFTIETGSGMVSSKDDLPRKVEDVDFAGEVRVVKAGAEEVEYEILIQRAAPGKQTQKAGKEAADRIDEQVRGLMGKPVRFILPLSERRFMERRATKEQGMLQPFLAMLFWARPVQPVGVRAKWRPSFVDSIKEKLGDQLKEAAVNYEITRVRGNLVTVKHTDLMVIDDDGEQTTVSTEKLLTSLRNDPLPRSMDALVATRVERVAPVKQDTPRISFVQHVRLKWELKEPKTPAKR